MTSSRQSKARILLASTLAFGMFCTVETSSKAQTLVPCSFSREQFENAEIFTKALLLDSFSEEPLVKVFYKPPFAREKWGVAVGLGGTAENYEVIASQGKSRLPETEISQEEVRFHRELVITQSLDIRDELLTKILFAFQHEMLKARYPEAFSWNTDPYVYEFHVQMEGFFACAELRLNSEQPDETEIPILRLAKALFELPFAADDPKLRAAAEARLLGALRIVEQDHP